MSTKNSAVKQVKDEIENLKDTAEKTVNSTEHKIEKIKDKVSDNLSSAAVKMHDKADSTEKLLNKKTDDAGKYVQQTIEKAGKLGHQAANALSDSSDYVENIDIQKAKESVAAMFKSKPEATVVAAALLGLLVGYLVGRKTA